MGRIVLSKIPRHILVFLQVVAGIALLAMLSIVTANIIGRVFFRHPIMGTLELAGFTGVIVASVAVGFAEWERRNIVVDMLITRLPGKVQSLANRFTFFLSLVAIGILLWAVVGSSMESLKKMEETLTLGVYVFPFRFTWAIGLLFLFVLLLVHFIQSFRGGSDK